MARRHVDPCQRHRDVDEQPGERQHAGQRDCHGRGRPGDHLPPSEWVAEQSVEGLALFAPRDGARAHEDDEERQGYGDDRVPQFDTQPLVDTDRSLEIAQILFHGVGCVLDVVVEKLAHGGVESDIERAQATKSHAPDEE